MPEQWPTELENPPALSPKEYFSEQSPIFCTSEIPFEAFGKHMQNYVDWLVGCFGFNGPLRQYFSLYRAVSKREGERGEKG